MNKNIYRNGHIGRGTELQDNEHNLKSLLHDVQMRLNNVAQTIEMIEKNLTGGEDDTHVRLVGLAKIDTRESLKTMRYLTELLSGIWAKNV